MKIFLSPTNINEKWIDECLTVESQLINAGIVTELDGHANKQMKKKKEMHQIGVFLSDRFECEFSWFSARISKFLQ